MSTDIKERIAIMGSLFVIGGLVRSYVVATDTTLLRSNGHMWHKSSMKEGIIPRSGIDTDARWGRSRTRGWLFGYKLHMICSTEPSSTIVPLSADVTTANVSDKPVYPDVVAYLSPKILWKIHLMIADPGYDGKKLYDLSLKRDFNWYTLLKDTKGPKKKG